MFKLVISLKDNKIIISGSLDKLKLLNGYEFDWIPMKGIHENEGHDIGIIAQEVEKVVPEVVKQQSNGYLTVDYAKLVPILVGALQEHDQTITSLNAQLKNLQKENEDMKADLKAIKERLGLGGKP